MKTNREYWQNRIKEIEDSEDGVAIVNDEPRYCDETSCNICARNTNNGHCSFSVALEWGEREHKEAPLLSGDEAEFIRLCVKFSGFDEITKFVVWKGIDHVCLRKDTTRNKGLLVNWSRANTFAAMESGKKYTIEELIGHQNQ